MTNEAFDALFWGFVSGGALVLGAMIGYLVRMPPRVVAGVMAFGSGVLISALSFELMEEAVRTGGLAAAAAGFLGGALIYGGANRILATLGAKHRKRSGDQQAQEAEEGGSGIAIAVGALIDGIPESLAIGLSILHGGSVSVATVVAIFLSNLPEGLSSSAGMRKAGRSEGFVFGIWTAIAVACSLASLAGFVVFDGFSPGVVAATTAVAAGGMLAMIVDTMIPEAFAETHDWAGLIVVAGFLVSFLASQTTG
jgi:ZIP family zinc transporter